MLPQNVNYYISNFQASLSLMTNYSLLMCIERDTCVLNTSESIFKVCSASLGVERDQNFNVN